MSECFKCSVAGSSRVPGIARYAVGGATLVGSCFGASDHDPVSFRRVGQSVDLPGKARRWGHDLRGSRQSGWLKSRSRPPQLQRTLPAFLPAAARAPPRPQQRTGVSGTRRGTWRSHLSRWPHRWLLGPTTCGTRRFPRGSTPAWTPPRSRSARATASKCS